MMQLSIEWNLIRLSGPAHGTVTINCKQNYPRCVGSRVHDTVTWHNYMKLKRMMYSLSHKLSYNYFGMSGVLMNSYCPRLGNFKLIIILKLKLTPIVIPSCLSGIAPKSGERPCLKYWLVPILSTGGWSHPITHILSIKHLYFKSLPF